MNADEIKGHATTSKLAEQRLFQTKNGWKRPWINQFQNLGVSGVCGVAGVSVVAGVYGVSKVYGV